MKNCYFFIFIFIFYLSWILTGLTGSTYAQSSLTYQCCQITPLRNEGDCFHKKLSTPKHPFTGSDEMVTNCQEMGFYRLEYASDVYSLFSRQRIYENDMERMKRGTCGNIYDPQTAFMVFDWPTLKARCQQDLTFTDEENVTYDLDKISPPIQEYFEDLNRYFFYRKQPHEKSWNPFHKLKKISLRKKITQEYHLTEEDWQWIRKHIVNPANKEMWAIRLGKLKKVFSEKSNSANLLKVMKLDLFEFEELLSSPQRYGDLLSKMKRDFTIEHVLSLMKIPSLENFLQLIKLPQWQNVPLQQLPLELIDETAYEAATWFHPPLTPPEYAPFAKTNKSQILLKKFAKERNRISLQDFSQFKNWIEFENFFAMKKLPAWKEISTSDFLSLDEYDRERIQDLQQMQSIAIEYNPNPEDVKESDHYQTSLEQVKSLYKKYPKLEFAGPDKFRRNYFELYQYLPLLTRMEGIRPLVGDHHGKKLTLTGFWLEDEYQNQKLQKTLDKWKKELEQDIIRFFTVINKDMDQLGDQKPLESLVVDLEKFQQHSHDPKIIKRFFNLVPLLYDEQGKWNGKNQEELLQEITSDPTFWISYLWHPEREGLDSLLLGQVLSKVESQKFLQYLWNDVKKKQENKKQSLLSQKVKSLSLEKLDPLTAITKGQCAADCSLWTTPFLSLHPDIDVFQVLKGGKSIGYSLILRTKIDGKVVPYVLALSAQHGHLSENEIHGALLMIMNQYQADEFLLVDTNKDNSFSMSNDSQVLEYWEKFSNLPKVERMKIDLPAHWNSVIKANRLSNRGKFKITYREDSNFRETVMIKKEVFQKFAPKLLASFRKIGESSPGLLKKVKVASKSEQELTPIQLKTLLSKDLEEDDYLRYQIASHLHLPPDEIFQNPSSRLRQLNQSLTFKRPCLQECREDLITLLSLPPEQLPLEEWGDQEKYNLLRNFFLTPFIKSELPDPSNKILLNNIKLNLKKVQLGLKQTFSIPGSRHRKKKLSTIYMNSLRGPWKDFLQRYGDEYREWGDVFWPSVFTQLTHQDQAQNQDQEDDQENLLALVPQNKNEILKRAKKVDLSQVSHVSQDSLDPQDKVIDLSGSQLLKRSQKGNSCYAETAGHLIDSLMLEYDEKSFKPTSAAYLSFLEKLWKRENDQACLHGGLFESGKIGPIIEMINRYGLCSHDYGGHNDQGDHADHADHGDQIVLMVESLELIDLLSKTTDIEEMAKLTIGLDKHCPLTLVDSLGLRETLQQNKSKDEIIPLVTKKVIETLCPHGVMRKLPEPMSYHQHHGKGTQLIKKVHQFLDHSQHSRMSLGFCGQLLIAGSGFRPASFGREHCFLHSAAVEGRKLSPYGETLIGLVSTWGEKSQSLLSPDWEFDQEKNLIWIPESELIANLNFLDEVRFSF